MNKNLKAIKKIIKENIEDANCGLFNTKNIIGDQMFTLYEKDGVTIDICYRYSYFEILGLNEHEFREILKYYYALRSQHDD